MDIRLKRVYEPPSPDDGHRVLVERLWPRGLSKERAAVALWLKEVAPTPGLRRWYGHDPHKRTEFARRYRAELRERTAELDQLRLLAGRGRVSLVFASRDAAGSSAAVLRDVLTEQPRRAAAA